MNEEWNEESQKSLRTDSLGQEVLLTRTVQSRDFMLITVVPGAFVTAKP